MRPRTALAAGAGGLAVVVLSGAVGLYVVRDENRQPPAEPPGQATRQNAATDAAGVIGSAADTASVPIDLGPPGDAPAQVGTLPPPDDPDLAATESAPVLTGRKAPLLDLARMSPSQRGAHLAMLRGRRHVEKARMQRAAQAARDEGACAEGDQGACGRLAENDGASRAALKSAKERLEKSCDAGRLDACLQRGDLDLWARSPDASKAWFDKSQALLEAARAACTTERDCRRAERLATALKNRQAKLTPTP